MIQCFGVVIISVIMMTSSGFQLERFYEGREKGEWIKYRLLVLMHHTR